MVNRNHSGETKCERLLREAMTKSGIPFEQEAGILEYHVDFLVGGRICVEVDGYSHLSALVRGRDNTKTRHLEDLGYTVMRVQDPTISDPRLLRAFVASIKEQLAAEYRAANPGGFASKPFDSAELAALKDKLSRKPEKPRKDEEAEMFLKAVDKLGPAPRKPGPPKKRKGR